MLAYNAGAQIHCVGNFTINPGDILPVPDDYVDSLTNTSGVIVGTRQIKEYFRSTIPKSSIDFLPHIEGCDVVQVTSPLRKCGVVDYTNHLIDNMTEFRGVSIPWNAGYDLVSAGLMECRIIHFQYNAAYAGNIQYLSSIASMQDIPTVCTFHDLPVKVFNTHDFDAIVCHTQSDITWLKGVYADCNNVYHIPQGFLPLFSGEPVSSGRDPLIGFFGFLSPHKGIHVLVSAMKDVLANFPNAGCRVISSKHHDMAEGLADGYVEHLHNLAKDSGIDSAFEWIHEHISQDESLALLAGCDLIVLPYIAGSHGGSSASLRFCMSSGTPVLCSDVGILSDILEREGVFRFPLADSENLGRYIVQSLDRKILSDKRKSVRKTVKKYSWKKIAERTEGLYKCLLKYQ